QLGAGQFDEDDVRLLEVLAGHAAVSLEKARMYERQRREAEQATTLLELADALIAATTREAGAELAVDAAFRPLQVPEVGFWLEDQATKAVVCLAHLGESVRSKAGEAIAPLEGVKGWIAVRPPADFPFHLDGARMALLAEVTRRASAALCRLG